MEKESLGISDYSVQFLDTLKDLKGTSDKLYLCLNVLDSISNEMTDDVTKISQNFSQAESFLQSIINFLKENEIQLNDFSKNIDVTKKIVMELDNIVNLTSERTISAVSLFEDLSGYAQNINEIVDVVSNVSEQTTLLAFNAAIEAAKAGDFGDGFAVVADEVRVLADTAEKNVREIEFFIQESLQNISSAMSEISKLKILTKLNEKKTKIICKCFDMMGILVNKASSEIEVFHTKADQMLKKVISLKQFFEKFNENYTKTGTEIEKASNEINTLSQKVSGDIVLFNNILEIDENLESGGIDDSNYKLYLGFVDEMSVSVRTYKYGKTLKISSDQIFNLISEFNKEFNEFAHETEIFQPQLFSFSENTNNLISIGKDISEQLAIMRISDHLIYNEILENSIKTKTLYGGQINPKKCAFGKWLYQYSPKNDDESKFYEEIIEIHENIHSNFGEILELMKQNKYSETETIFKDKIVPLTKTFKEKTAKLIEGIIIINTGYSYSFQIFNKINDSLMNFSKPFNKILNVVGEMDNISVQTNMLYVSGSIEAARAGEYGKGFSFVGNDIKNLASETNDNNEKIKDLLDKIFDLWDSAKKDFDDVNFLTLSQTEIAKKTVNSLVQIERINHESEEIYNNISASREELSKKFNESLERINKTKNSLSSFIQHSEKINTTTKLFISQIHRSEHIFNDLEALFKI